MNRRYKSGGEVLLGVLLLLHIYGFHIQALVSHAIKAKCKSYTSKTQLRTHHHPPRHSSGWNHVHGLYQ